MKFRSDVTETSFTRDFLMKLSDHRRLQNHPHVRFLSSTLRLPDSVPRAMHPEEAVLLGTREGARWCRRGGKWNPRGRCSAPQLHIRERGRFPEICPEDYRDCRTIEAAIRRERS